MKSRYAIALTLLIPLGVLAALIAAAHGSPLVMFEPKGIIASEEGSLIERSIELMLVVVVPVLALAFYFAWHYRAGNTAARYEPEWEHSILDELVWWAVPLEIILVLAALTWQSTRALDPHKPLSDAPPLSVEVVALPWKWLFIYPSLGVASVNALELPVGRPVAFSITADAPMNSFWIPQLGGQIYAMTGMVTSLNLEADEAGQYEGYSANYSGDGFAQMHFTATAADPAHFDAWLEQVKSARATLNDASYDELSQPGTSSVAYYGSVTSNMFSHIVSRFLNPDNPTMDMH